MKNTVASGSRDPGAKKGRTAAASQPILLTPTRSWSPCAADGSEILRRHVLQSNYLPAYSQH